MTRRIDGRPSEVILDALPWATFLPEEGINQMSAELIEVAQDADSLHNPAPMAILLEQWRHSAEVYADPDLHSRLSAEPDGNLGLVPGPGGRA